MVDLLIIILFINYDNKKRKWIEILFAFDFASFHFYFYINWYPFLRSERIRNYTCMEKGKKNGVDLTDSEHSWLLARSNFFRKKMWKDSNVAPVNLRSARLTRMEASSLFHPNLNMHCGMVEAKTKFWKFQLLLHRTY